MHLLIEKKVNTVCYRNIDRVWNIKKSVHSYEQYDTRYMQLCCNILQMLQILQIRLPVTSLFKKDDIQWHQLSSASISCYHFCTYHNHVTFLFPVLSHIPSPNSTASSSVCYQLHSRLILFWFIIVIFMPSSFHRKTKDMCIKEQGHGHQLVIHT